MNHILRPSPEMTAICAELGGHGMSSSSSVRLLLLLLFADFIGSVAEAQSTSFSSYGANGAQFNSSMAIIVVVLISVFFVMGFLSIYLRQCSERDEVSLARNGAGGTRWMRAPRGLDPALIETFPKLMYADVKDHKLGKGALECAVCLSEFDDDDSLRLLPKCDHVFHTECIDAWLASHTTCPVCRADLLSNSDDQQPVAVASPLPDAAAPPASPPDHVVITVDESLPRKASLPPLPPNPDRTPRRPKAATRFPRSNSTGHSIVLVHAADDCDRFTLRLPEHIRRDVINGNLRRSTSFVVFPQQEEGSSRGGRSSKLKPERWSFFSKTFSTRSPRRDTGAGEGSTRRGFFFSPRRDVGAGEGGSTRRGAEMAGDGRSVESNQDLSSVRNLPFDKPPS